MANGINLSALRRAVAREGQWRKWRDIGRDIRHRYPASRLQLRILDHCYWCVPRGAALDIVQHIGAHKSRYLGDRRDCDDFAGFLKYGASHGLGVSSIAFVNDESAAHAYNLIIALDKKEVDIFAVEPQTGRIILTGTDTHPLARAVITL